MNQTGFSWFMSCHGFCLYGSPEAIPQFQASKGLEVDELLCALRRCGLIRVSDP